MRDEVWMSKNGPIKVKDMSLEHVRNALAHLDRHGIGVSNKAAYDVMQRRVIAVEEFKREAKGAGARIIDSQRLTAQCWVAETVVLVAHLPDFSNGVWVAESAERHHANHNLDDLLAEIEAEVLAAAANDVINVADQHVADFATAHPYLTVELVDTFKYKLTGEVISFGAEYAEGSWTVTGWRVVGKGATLIEAYDNLHTEHDQPWAVDQHIAEFTVHYPHVEIERQGDDVLLGVDGGFEAKYTADGWTVIDKEDGSVAKGSTLIAAYTTPMLPKQQPTPFDQGLPDSIIVQYPDNLHAEHVRAYNEQLREWLAGDRKILVLPPGTKITPVYDAC